MAEKVDPNLLSAYSIFEDMTSEQIQMAAEKITLKKFDAGEDVWLEGESGRDVFLLLDGTIEITQKLTLFTGEEREQSSHDKALIKLSHDIHPLIGEMALCANTPRSASVTAVTKLSLGFFSAEDLLHVIEEDPKFGYLFYRNVASIIAERLISANSNVLKLTTAFSLALQRGT